MHTSIINTAKTMMVALCVTITVVCATAQSQPMNADKISADSCSAAFATMMAQYLRPEVERQFPNDSTAVKEFVRGVRHAFDIRDVDAPYFLGVRNGLALIDRVDGMVEMGFPITVDDFCRQLAAAMTGKAMGFDPDSADAYLRRAIQVLNPPQQEVVLSPESQELFLAEQAAREGVTKEPDGLLFEVITEGEGAQPTDSDFVKVLYTGRLSDGTVFDESQERPVQFPVGNLVRGFSEGLKKMKLGGTYRIIFPAELGYGSEGAGGVIPPGAALDFTVTLVDILHKN